MSKYDFNSGFLDKALHHHYLWPWLNKKGPHFNPCYQISQIVPERLSERSEGCFCTDDDSMRVLDGNSDRSVERAGDSLHWGDHWDSAFKSAEFKSLMYKIAWKYKSVLLCFIESYLSLNLINDFFLWFEFDVFRISLGRTSLAPPLGRFPFFFSCFFLDWDETLPLRRFPAITLTDLEPWYSFDLYCICHVHRCSPLSLLYIH